jgi:hypothetical protein
MAEYIHEYPFEQVVGITVIIGQDGTKNDADGNGHRYYYAKNPDYIHKRDHNITYCYVLTMYEWACRGRPTSNQPFFSCNTDPVPWCITERLYNNSIKQGVKLCGIIDSRRYSSKSLRIAGASALAAANIPDYTIKQLGRWKSDAFLIYIRNSTKAFHEAIRALSNISTLTTSDLSHWHPAGYNIK